MDEVHWNDALLQMDGHLLQSWRWGEFKRRQGWGVERISGANRSGQWMAQVLFKSIGPLTLAYVPRGPALSGDHQAIFPEALSAMDEACRRRRAMSLVLEPSQRFQLKGTYKDYGLVRWLRPFNQSTSFIVPVGDDESMLQRMRKQTRYNVRLAARQGIGIECHSANEEAICAFHHLLTDTAQRKGIPLLPYTYYKTFCDAFGDEVEVLLGKAGPHVVAASVMVRFGKEASYLFAATSTEHRGLGAGALLVFASAQWAREHGCTQIDLGNVGNEGLRTFKLGFGGTVHEYLPPMERRYRPTLSWIARRAIITLNMRTVR